MRLLELLDIVVYHPWPHPPPVRATPHAMKSARKPPCGRALRRAPVHAVRAKAHALLRAQLHAIIHAR
jgi:hypothetical protein